MDLRVERDVAVVARDGTRLATDIYRALADEPAPTLLVRVPYGKQELLSRLDARALPNLMRLVEAGYAIVWQDCRGTFGSEGDFEVFEHEGADGEDTVRWLVAQPWSNGRVGMYGRSALGFAQWHLNAGSGSSVSAIAPAFSDADHYAGPFHHDGGLLCYSAAITWSFRQALARAERDARAKREDAERTRRCLHKVLDDPAEFLNRLPLSDRPELRRGAPWYQQWMDHDSYDEYWRRISAAEHLDRAGAPALMFAGWFDINLGENMSTFAKLRHCGSSEARRGTRLVVGPWSHGELTGRFPERRFGPTADMMSQDFTGAHLRFYERWVKGGGSDDSESPVRIFVMGIDEWRDEADWPLPDATCVGYYLSSSGNANTSSGDGVLSREEPWADAVDRFLYDPHDPVPTLGGHVYGSLADPNLVAGPADQAANESRGDVLCYSTPELTRPLEVTGPIRLTLHVSSSAPDTDFIAKLVDVYPDGRALFVTEGAVRARYRTSLSNPQLLKPNRIYEIDLQLWPTSNVFLPGHRLRLEITSSNYPRFDRNSNSGRKIAYDTESEFTRAMNSVHHGPRWPSRLHLPIVERAHVMSGNGAK